MVTYIVTRFLRMLSVVLAVSILTFFLINLLPGSPIDTILGAAAGNLQARHQLTLELGLNHPIYVRYFIWLGHALQGNLGTSYVSQGSSVTGTIFEHLPLTLELMILAEILSLVVAIPLGIACALKPDGWFDRVVGTFSIGLLALPAFVLGPLLIFVLAIKTNVFPPSGETTWFTIGSGYSPAIIATPQSLVMPAVTLAAGQLAIFSRVLRGDLVSTLKSEFILMARSKGFSRWYILFRHALRPSSISLVSLIGLSVGGLIAGALVVENVFALPGMGTLIVDSILKRDYLMVQGIALLISTGFVFVNFVTDAVYAALDPRIRRARLVG